MAENKKPWGRLVLDEAGQAVPIIKRRRGYVLDEDFSLDPGSLAGSVFHVMYGHEIIWQGVVVAEPQSGKYLVEIDRLEEGATAVQRLFTLDTMLGLGDEARRLLENASSEASAPVLDPMLEFRFFDSVEEANRAFVDWTVMQQNRRKNREEV
jgi:hypothetical protein